MIKNFERRKFLKIIKIFLIILSFFSLFRRSYTKNINIHPYHPYQIPPPHT